MDMCCRSHAVCDAVEFETDREHFSVVVRARAGPPPHPYRATFGATGAVLDPIVSLRARLRVPPGVTARVSFTTVVAEMRMASARSREVP